MDIPLVDLRAQYNSIKGEIDQAIANVIRSGQFILGSEVKALEEEIAYYCGVKHAVGVASGTDALHLALLAYGIGPGDEVITTPFTFIATAEAITQCGATPVFVDIHPHTYNIDPAEIEPQITKNAKAIIPVHLYGQPAEMDAILALAKRYNLKVIEDCAQALGAEYKGRKVGSLGDAGCLSFFPAKTLGAFGDGGMVVTDNPQIADKVDMLRQHGGKIKHYHLIPGFNSRLDALQAAILRVKLRHLDRWNDSRRRIADVYGKLLGKIDGIQTPCQQPHTTPVFNYYTIRLKDFRISRGQLQQHLKSQGIDTAIYYPLSLHLQEAYKPLGYKWGDFPESEHAQDEVLSLPMYPELSAEQIERIVKTIMRFLGGERRKKGEAEIQTKTKIETQIKPKSQSKS